MSVDNLPTFIIIGAMKSATTSLYYYLSLHPEIYMSKIKELELLEQLVPATKISKLSNGTILGMQVPPNYNVEKGLAAAKPAPPRRRYSPAAAA